MMKHVVKQDWMGCAVATAAMLGDVTYEEVAACPSLPHLARTRHANALCTLLTAVTGSTWRVTTFWFRRPDLTHFCFPEWPVAVFLQDAPFRPRLGQWVVIKREVVHDPGERTAYLVSQYPRRDWRIARLAQPRWPAAFAGEQMDMLSLAEPRAPAGAGRDYGFSEFTISARGRRW